MVWATTGAEKRLPQPGAQGRLLLAAAVRRLQSSIAVTSDRPGGMGGTSDKCRTLQIGKEGERTRKQPG